MRVTKADLIESTRYAERKADVLGTALHLVLTSEPTARETVKEGEETYIMSVYGPDRADGGVLIRRFRYPGQTDTIEASRWLEWESDSRATARLGGVYLKFAIAAERLRAKVARQQEKAFEEAFDTVGRAVNGPVL